MKLYYIILEKSVLLSKKKYNSWREIQDEFINYKASLGPWSEEELYDYFRLDYYNPLEWPFTEEVVKNFINSSDILISESID